MQDKWCEAADGKEELGTFGDFDGEEGSFMQGVVCAANVPSS